MKTEKGIGFSSSNEPSGPSTPHPARIAVVGLGYVGLPLSLQFCRRGNRVLGLDIDRSKVEKLNRGESYIHHIASREVQGQIETGSFRASSDFSSIRDCHAVIICVPTPLNKNREPDISFVLSTGQAIAPYLQPGSLVVLESTTYPGTTDTPLREVLESGSGLIAGKDFFLAFSPEREDPGNPDSNVATIPKVVGGYSPKCLRRAVELYRSGLDSVVEVSSCRAAEATKLLENIFRSVNIALVNELKLVYDAMGIDIWEVIEAAKTKPFGFMPFYPGPGLGGHCIPIDPFYLTWKAREFGMSTRFIELAGEINTSMPDHVLHKLTDALNDCGKPLRGSSILLVGLAYKANVDDDRESPGYVLMDKLASKGAHVAFYDPFIPVIRPSREHGHWAGTKSIGWQKASIQSFDAVLIATAHRDVNYKQLGEWAKLIVDTRNAMHGVDSMATVVKA
jgi:UDP-N-acetyl-D-glucosamine dehydrogenase